MVLDDRKRRILQAIIDDYVDTAEPVGSRTIARKFDLGLSSATIRNEMSDLEEMGYLEQPHTSAGRIPSDRGYRFYVDQLMKHYDIAVEEAESIRKALEVKINEISQLIQKASYVLSSSTRYTSIAMAPMVKRSSIKTIQLVPVDPMRILLIIVTNAGMVKNSIVRVEEEVSYEFLNRVSRILSERLYDLTLEQIHLNVVRDIEKEMRPRAGILKPILDAVTDSINAIDDAEVFLEGTVNIFNFPEYSHIEKAKEFLRLLETKETMRRLLIPEDDNIINIVIGKENVVDGTQDCSVIKTTYCIGDNVIGSMGVIGPTRMEYSRVISSMKLVRRMVNEALARLIGED